MRSRAIALPPRFSTMRTARSTSRRWTGRSARTCEALVRDYAGALHYRAPLLDLGFDEVVAVLRGALDHRGAARHEGLVHLRVLRGAVQRLVEPHHHFARCSGRR